MGLAVLIASAVAWQSCSEEKKGEALARTHCGSCHVFPEPSLLPRQIWAEGVLPQMALLMGIPQSGRDPMQTLSISEIQYLTEAGVFPNRPQLSEADWQLLVDYYLSQAPERLALPPDTAKLLPLPGFELVVPPQPIMPLVTTVRHDATHGQIWVSQRTGTTFLLDASLRIRDSLYRADSPFSAVRPLGKGRWQVLSMGTMDPNDLRNGEWLSVRKEQGKWRGSTRIKGLQRPVHQSFEDINGDGREDVVICEYGNYLGKLAWYEATEADTLIPHLIENRSGARMSYWQDQNGDGRKDLWVLWAQGDEHIAVYINNGKGEFIKKNMLRFPPVYGSRHFELADFNGDGAVDILYTNGDNADYSHTLKPYHGVRIFLNDRAGSFKEHFFYPLHGASEAHVADFDGDGDLDIVAFSFFPNFDQSPTKSFVYLENQGKGQFVARSFTDPNRGRWLSMDVADVDQDGDLDILLGSFFLSVTPTPDSVKTRWLRDRQGVILLKNNLN